MRLRVGRSNRAVALVAAALAAACGDEKPGQAEKGEEKTREKPEEKAREKPEEKAREEETEPDPNKLVFRPRLCADRAACREECGKRRAGACARMFERTRGRDPDGEKLVAQLCDQGHPEACHVRSLQLESNRGAAAKALRRACDLGHGPSCLAIAANTKDRARAQELRGRAAASLERHCRSEDAQACTAIAHAARFPSGDETEDLARSRWYYDRACDLGDEKACYALVEQLAGKHPTVEMGLLSRGCELGDPRACARMGDHYAGGTMVGKDLDRAAAAWQRACESGEAESCGELARALSDGRLPADPARAEELKKRADELARDSSAKPAKR